MLSVIINTAAGAPHAKHVISSGKVPYSWRAYALQNFIIPWYVDNPAIYEIIVAGVWHPGDGYEYVHVEPEHYNWADCIAQRHAGFNAANGDVLVFQHDDHILRDMPSRMAGFDVISPSRWTWLRGDPEKLNDGSADGYIDGHCAIYKREVIERCPWSQVPKVFTLDVEHTKQIREAGFTILFTEHIKCWDVEYGAEPWK